MALAPPVLPNFHSQHNETPWSRKHWQSQCTLPHEPRASSNHPLPHHDNANRPSAITTPGRVALAPPVLTYLHPPHDGTPWSRKRWQSQCHPAAGFWPPSSRRPWRLAWHGTAQAQTAAEDEKPAAAAASFDFLAVSEDEPWTAAVAAPVVATQGQVAGQTPLLVVLSGPPTREAEALIDLAAPNARWCWLPWRRRSWAARCPSDRRRCWWSVPIRSRAASWWRNDSGTGRGAWSRQRPRMPRASFSVRRLAAKLAIPLLLRERSESRTSLGRALQELGVEEVLAAVADADHAPLGPISRASTTSRS